VGSRVGRYGHFLTSPHTVAGKLVSVNGFTVSEHCSDDGPVEELIVELQARRRGAMVDAFTVTYHTRDGGRYARTFRRALVMCGTRIAPEYC
jgi:hypothetical protein